MTRPRPHLTAALLLAASAVVFTARAQEEIEVRGSQAGGFSSRADERKALREVTDAASLVEPLAGVHVRRMGGDDSFATLSIRGSSSSQVAVYLAGVPLSGGADPTLDLATLPLWPGSQAKVHRSFSPATLGPGSLGGTLVLDPPRPSSAPGTDIWWGVGSYGVLRTRVGDVHPVGQGLLVTGLSASRSTDDFTYFDPLASTPGHDVFTTRDNAGHAAVSGLVGWTRPFRFGDRAGVLSVTTLAQARKQGLAGSIKAPTPESTLETTRLLGALEVNLDSGMGTWLARMWGRRELTHFRTDARGARLTLDAMEHGDVVVAAGGALGHRWRWDSLRVDASLDGSEERYAPGLYVGGVAPPAATRASVGLGVDAEWRMSTAPACVVGLSGRLDRWRDVAADTRDDNRGTGHVGVELSQGPWTVAMHGGAVARPPSFVERFGNRGIFLGDPALRPESAWVIDGGGRLRGQVGPLRVELELTGFATWAEDLIVFQYVGAYGRAKATNIGRARLLGVEGELRLRGGNFEGRVSYTGLATANFDVCGSTSLSTCVRPALPGRPAHDLVLDLAYAVGPVRVRYGLDLLSGMFADASESVPVPARVLQGMGVRWEVAKGLRLALDVRNLFDVRVATYDGVLGPVRAPIGDAFEYPLPGRTVLGSVRFSTVR